MAVSTIESGNGNGDVADVTNRRLHTAALLVLENGDPAPVDGDGRLLTSAVVPCVSKAVHTTYLSGVDEEVDTLNSRGDRCSMLFANTGSVTVYMKMAASDPTASDIPLAPGEKFAVPFTTDTEVRLYATAGSWSVVAVEGAAS